MPSTPSDAASAETRSIKAIDALSAHRITSGQVVIDLQTAVKELVENSLDAGATSIEVRFKDHGLESIEVIDNGSGIAPADYDVVAVKHYTSKLASFEDLDSVATFGFRGEALASLCALSASVTITTTTAETAPVATILQLDRLGKVTDRSGKAARQKGTTVTVTGIFKPLPVRRKEFERNAKREYGKALNLLNAYALVPCVKENGGVRLTVSNTMTGRAKSVQLRTDGSPSSTASISALWGPKTLENLVELDLTFEVETERSILRRQKADKSTSPTTTVSVRGMISKFSLNCGRSASDRQFFFVNGRPCNPSKVQKAFNEVYRTFNVNQVPFVVADFRLPNGSHDINVSPDKRTIFIHSEDNLVQALKNALEEHFSPERSTYTVRATQAQTQTSSRPSTRLKGVEAEDSTHNDAPPAASVSDESAPLFFRGDEDDQEERPPARVDDEDDFDTGQPHLLIQEEEEVFPDPSPDPTSVPADIPLTHDDVASVVNATDDIAMSQEVESGDYGILKSAAAAELDSSESGSQVEDRPMSPTATQMPLARTEQLAASPEPDEIPRHSQVTSVSSQSDRILPIPSLRSAVAREPTPTVVRTTFNNNTSRVTKKDTAQLVLSTAGAAWNLRRAAGSGGPDAESPRKRVKLSHDNTRPGGIVGAQRTSKQEFKSKMASYALPGSQLAQRSREAEADASEHDQEEDELDDGFSAGEPSSLKDTDSELQLRPPSAATSDVAGSSQGASQIDDDYAPSQAAMAVDRPPEIIKETRTDTVDVRFDLSATTAAWNRMRVAVRKARPMARPHGAPDSLARDAGVDNAEADESRAQEALSRIIAKDDFSTMEVLGQFNLGFIIIRRRRTGTTDALGGAGAGAPDQSATLDDLFIVDQHAADEKYNFETLQQTTRINSQALIRPKPLELTASDQLLALENVEVLRQNGFEIDSDGTVDDDGGSQCRLRLVAQPVSKSTVFDMKDLEELLDLLRDRPQGQTVRCKKARDMFAMRACRKSVMVGMPLKLQQMISIVRHMGTMDQPWNCPHGRPTMRHLSDIANFGRKHLSDKRPDWQAFTQD